jgi:hypothetical protein
MELAAKSCHRDREMKSVEGAGNETDANAKAATAQREIAKAAQRALAEASERRRSGQLAGPALPEEFNGRGGLDPVRYGDWETKGIASDF